MSRRYPARRAVVALSLMFAMLVTLFAVLQADTASAQGPICLQYPNECDGDAGPTGGTGSSSDDLPAFGSGGDGTGTGAGGELPFTGYPLTFLILLLLILLAAGLTIRAYVAVRDRPRRLADPTHF